MRFVGVEAAGHGVHTHHHSATLVAGTVGVLHGAFSYLLQDPWGNIQEAHSLAPGLDYPGVGPEHAWFKDTGPGRIRGGDATPRPWRGSTCSPGPRAFCRPWNAPTPSPICKRLAPEYTADDIMIVNLSGRGDKDVDAVAEAMEVSGEPD